MLNTFVVTAFAMGLMVQGQSTKVELGPYASLFQPKPSEITAAPGAVFVRAQPLKGGRMVPAPVIAESTKLEPGPCGMPTLAARADLDPRIVVPIPESARDSAKIRAIPLRPCGR